MALPPDISLRELIQSARQQHAKGAGTVLDVLLRQYPQQAHALQQQLHEVAGMPSFVNAKHVHALLDKAPQGRDVVVFQVNGKHYLGMADPWDEAAFMQLSRQYRQPLLPAAVTTVLLDELRDPSRVEQGASPSASNATKATFSSSAATQSAFQAEGPIVSFVDTAIRSACDTGASDIHFECDRHGVTVKHRLDGVMARFARMEGEVSAQEVISRIKVLAQLDITERRLPQDGRFRYQDGRHAIDLRVSIMPSVFGEDAVLRLLDKAQLKSTSADKPAIEPLPVSLDMLGFDPANAQLIRDLANEPSGMLLVTGPTGSGKTTTIYATLSEINTGLEKIITIEDPVEYELPGVLQIPVNERKGLTFAKGLRSILRHDPDRILVGEIRDAETAEIAVQSALTGHLVFTTVHANGVADIIGRFRHFGLDMFGFMSSLNGVVVQRLVRQLCQHCVGERALTPREQQWFQQLGQDVPPTVPKMVGCEHCHHSGYKGRFVLAEVHAIDDGFRDHVTEGSAMSVLKQYAYSRPGVQSLAQQAARCVMQQRTTLEEIKRVVGWM